MIWSSYKEVIPSGYFVIPELKIDFMKIETLFVLNKIIHMTCSRIKINVLITIVNIDSIASLSKHNFKTQLNI